MLDSILDAADRLQLPLRVGMENKRDELGDLTTSPREFPDRQADRDFQEQGVQGHTMNCG